MPVLEETDVVVIGAGAIGASSALHLAGRGLRVTVLEALGGPAEGSTGRSFAGVRGQWADPLNIELSLRSIRFFRDFARDHGIDVGFRPSGYLLLVGPEAWAEHLAAVDLQRSHGVAVEVLDPAAAARITPFAPDGVAGATWGPEDGLVDPHLVAAGFLSVARSRGAQVRFRTAVDAVARDDVTGGWTVTAGETTIRTRYVVNAAGGWGGAVAALAGFDVPVVHSRRNVYATAAGVLDRPVPMTIDVASGVYLRSEGTRLLFGRGRPDQADGYDTTVDWAWMETVLGSAVARFPWLAELPLDRAACWAGTYELTPDHTGIVGANPESPTWVDACGFSGHGLMQSPEVGRLVAEQIGEGAITSVDATPLRLERFGRAATAPAVGLVF